MGDDPERPFMLPGDPVTKEQREKMGPARVRRWFENGTLEIADFKAPEPQRERALQVLKDATEKLREHEQEEERVNADRLTKKLEEDGIVTRDDLGTDDLAKLEELEDAGPVLEESTDESEDDDLADLADLDESTDESEDE